MYRVTADIQYDVGALAGLYLPAGYSISVANEAQALRLQCWLAKVYASDDFIQAAVTGHRYRVMGGVGYSKIAAQEEA